MLLKPLNEASLWRGKLQTEQNVLVKPPMILPKIRPTIGGTSPPLVPIWDEIRRGYELQSQEYWAGVKKRQQEYRWKETLETANRMRWITRPCQ